MIVTIDGPAGAGKSTAARTLAKRLGFRFLDTGAMYRAVAWAAIERQLGWDDPERLVELAHGLDIRTLGSQIWVNGQDVSKAIRTADITAVTHYAANNPGVRTHLVELQRLSAGHDHIVTEGRDQGTVVFPYAECKIFLTASPAERARRRVEDLHARGEAIPLAQVLEQQNERDRSDTEREVGPLVPADDAIQIITDGLSADEVVDRLEQLVRARWQPSVR